MINEKEIAIESIQKKLVGKRLTYEEIYAIMDEISHNRLGDVLTTYFAASGYAKGFTNEEIYFLTKAMVETGEKLHFSGIVADKHSIGGIPGSRTTLIVTPIIAAAGFTIPKSSSRAITTPSGTADTMEILAPVIFSKKKIYEIVKKTNGCIVWGGSFNIAPADDVLIKVEAPLLFESYDKIIISIMAKKIAFGATHVVIDLPYGKTAKVHRLSDAETLKEKFESIAKRFNIKIKVLVDPIDEPGGNGIGPILEARDALLVLEQKQERPLALEKKSIHLAGTLLKICLEDSSKEKQETIKKTFGTCKNWALEILKSGGAIRKMKEIIAAQGGNPKTSSDTLRPGNYSYSIKAKMHEKISEINSKNTTIIAKILGSPMQKGAGIFFHKKKGDKIEKGDILYTIYAETMYNLKEAKESLSQFPIFVF